jgi:adenylate kinase
MVGRPGSGKGTQGKMLADKLGAPIFSTGGEFRSLARGDTYLGKRLKGAMESGELLPHWLASFTFEKVLFSLQPEEKIVFEGACRTGPEAELMHEISLWLPRPYKAVYLRISEEEAWKRLLERAQKEARADDDKAAIRKRFEEYKTKNEAVIEHFRKEGSLVEIDGEHPIEEVHQAVLKALTLA